MSIVPFEKPVHPDEIDSTVSKISENDQVVILDSEISDFDILKLSLVEHYHVGLSENMKHVWIGGAKQNPSCPVADESKLPIIISYYTKNTPYEKEAKKLIESCEKLGLQYVIEGVANQGSWEANCAYKSQYVLDKWENLNKPVLWVDADALIIRKPTLLCGIDADFGIHKIDRWEFASGTIFFNTSKNAGLLIKEWVNQCRQNPQEWDQTHLDNAWEVITNQIPLKTFWLPESYTHIFDRHVTSGEDPEPVIRHYQASRQLKTAISDQPVTPIKNYPPSFKLARSSSRMFYSE